MDSPDRAHDSGSWLARMARLALALVALALPLTVPPGAALAQDERPLTSAEEAHVSQTVASLAPYLASAGLSQQEIGLAMNAVGVCLRTALANDLSQGAADQACGIVLDAFTVDRGATAYQLTPDDQAWIAMQLGGWAEALAGRLSQEELDAVRSSMGACLVGHLRRGEGREEALGSCALGLLPLLNQPELRQRLLQGR